MNSLALFDFDGTISSKDSFLDFLYFSFGANKYYQALFFTSPFLMGYKLGLYPNYRAKERLLTTLLQHMSLEHFNKMARDYANDQLPQIIRPKALEKLHWHQAAGHDITIVSASIENWLKPWCDDLEIKLLATQLEIIDGSVTGKISGDNCFGKHKVNRIKERYDLKQYQTIYAYGDTAGDKPMLELADQSFFRHFE